MYLTQHLHQAVQQQPHQPLTVCGGRERSAAEVTDRVARLGGALRELGVREGDLVSIVSFNSDRYFEVLMAIWWVGAAANLLNSRWSSGEIAQALDDAGSSVLFVDDECAPLVAGHAASMRVVHLGDGPAPADTIGYEELIAGAQPVPDLRRGADALAVLIYTGGTTGTAKAVMHSHRSLLTSSFGTMSYARAYHQGGASLVMAPMFHIAALLGMLSQCLVGGALVFVDRFVPAEVLALIGKHRISTLTAASTMLQMLYLHPDFATSDVSSVESIVYGAAPLPEAVLVRAMRAFPAASFIQGYGMSETAVIAMLTGSDHRHGGVRLKSAGRSVPHADNIIVDPDDAEVPRGTVGEIVTRGDHVMGGYWNRPEETAAALRDGWMHTGDLGYMDDEGYIFIVDRLKDMIISGGENVFSTEVERVIARHPAVASCAVIGLPDPMWGERVHAVVALLPGESVDADEIRDHVKSLIAGYKAPRSIQFVAELPTTAAGKIDKRKIRQEHAQP